MNRIFSFYKKHHSDKVSIYLGCILIGILAFVIIYGVSTLDVTYDSWIFKSYIEYDITQSYAGWMSFRNSPWGWPLTHTSMIAFPVGGSISFTDPIPLLCLFFKLISDCLPETFQFFGWYNFACFVLQALSAGLLISLFTRNKLIIYLSATLFVFSPVMIERAFRHSALASHFLILFALYLFFKSKKNNFQKIDWKFLLLAPLTPAIHPYFLPMIMGILFANVLATIRHTRSWIKPLLFLFLSIVLSLLVCYAFGLITSVGSITSGGFGYFSMNLNAIINPLSIGVETWSKFLRQRPQILGHYDGFNYLGLGILSFLSFLSIKAIIKVLDSEVKDKLKHVSQTIFKFIKNNRELIFVMSIFFLFAISNVISYGDKILLTYPLPKFIINLAGIFRASSRMFYPVFYMIYFGIIMILLRSYSKRIVQFLLIVLLSVQLIDLSPALIQKNQYFNSGELEYKGYFSTEPWIKIAKQYSSLFLLEEWTYFKNYPFAAYAAKNKILSNVNIFNRGFYAKLEDDYAIYRNRIEQGIVVDDRTAYLVHEESLYYEIVQSMDSSVYYAMDLGDFKIIAPIIE